MGNVPDILHDPAAGLSLGASWRVHGVETAMVGRAGELQHLVASFETAIEKSRVCSCLLTGDAGMGKSRLVHEFSQRVNTEFGDALLIAGAFAEASERPFTIVDRLLRNRFYISRSLSESELRQRLLEGIKAIVKSPGALEMAHRIAHLLGVPFPDSPFVEDSAEANMSAAQRALANLIRIDAETNPLVMVLEDLDFASAEELSLIRFMADSLSGAPVLCLMTGTPEFVAEHPEVIESLPQLEHIPLSPLSDAEVRTLVSQVLHRVVLVPDTLMERVCANSRGNPLIAEEILRILLAEGAVDTSDTEWLVREDFLEGMSLPIGLSDVVSIGLQRLTEDERRVLEWAAVVGESFWSGALMLIHNGRTTVSSVEDLWLAAGSSDDVVLGALEAAARKDVVRLEPMTAFPDQVEYQFKHAGTRKQLLDGLDDTERKRVHALVAVWHELQSSRGAPNQAPTIARHFEQAGHPGRAASYFLDAAQSAQGLRFNQRALGFYLKALDLLDETRILERMDALHEVGSLCDLTGEFEKAVPYLEEMSHWAWRIAAPSKGGAAHNKLGRVYRNLGRLDRAMEQFELAMHLFRRGNDRVGLASTLDDVGRVHWLKGNYRAADEHFKEGLALRRDIDEPRSLALSLNNIGSLFLAEGKFKEALSHFRESLGLRRKIDDKRGVAASLNNLSVILVERGETRAAMKLWSEALEASVAIGDRAMEGILHANMCEAERLEGNLDIAEEHLDLATEIVEECNQKQLLFEVLRNRGLLALGRQDARLALECIEKARGVAVGLESQLLEGIALRASAEVHAATVAGDRTDEARLKSAETTFRRSLELFEGLGHDIETARTNLSYGLYLLEAGLLVPAKKRLDAAHETFSRLGMRHLLKETERYREQL